MRFVLSIALMTTLSLTGTWAQADTNTPQKKGAKKVEDKKTIHALPPQAAAKVSKMIGLSKPLAGKHVLGAKLTDREITVTAGPKGKPVLNVRLVHPSVAPNGSQKVGEVAIVTNGGPAPTAMVTELKNRIQASGVKGLWYLIAQKPDPNAAPAPDATKDAPAVDPAVEAKAKKIEDILRKVSQLQRWGDSDKAIALLKSVPEPDDRGARVHIAVAWKRLGDLKRAKAALEVIKEPTPAERAVLALVSGAKPSAASALKGVTGKARCEFGMVLRAALELGQNQFAFDLASATVDGCPDVRVLHLEALRGARKEKAFRQAAEAALKALPNHPSVLQIAAEDRLKMGDYGKALELTQRLARLNPPAPGRWALLARSLSFEGNQEPAIRNRVAEALRKNPKDIVLQFSAGILMHFNDLYGPSNEKLLPLLKAGFKDTSTIQLFVALNEYNLGKKESAAKRIRGLQPKHAADGEIYYLRAEILRDIERPTAIADLKRHLKLISSSHYTAPSEIIRVKKLIAELEYCLEKKMKICHSEWIRPGRREGGKRPPGMKGAPPQQKAAQRTARPKMAPPEVKRAAPKAATAKGPAMKAADKGAEQGKDGAKSIGSSQDGESKAPIEMIILAIVALLGFVIWRRGTQE